MLNRASINVNTFYKTKKKNFEWQNKYVSILKNIIVTDIEHNLSMKIASTTWLKTMQ